MFKGAFARRNVILFGLIFFIGACASGNRFQFKRPGQIAFAGIKRLVIAPVAGIKQRHELEKNLIAEIEKTGFYIILRDDDVRHLMMKHNLTYDDIAAADSSQLSQIGAWLQADGILFSELKTLDVVYLALGSQKVEKLVWTGEYERDEFGDIVMIEDSTGAKKKKKKLKVKFIEEKFQLRDAKGEALFRLVDFQTGGVIGSWNKVEHYIENIAEGDKAEKFRDEKEIKKMLLDKIVREFVSEIAPRVEEVKVKLDFGIAELDSGIIFARKNEWQKALQVWERAEVKAPNNPGVYFNIGVAHEAMGDLKLAEMYYLKARLLDPENKKYQKTVRRIKEIWAEKEKMR